jgi:hypothetical protein
MVPMIFRLGPIEGMLIAFNRRLSLARATSKTWRLLLDQREIWEQRLDRMQDYVKGLATNKEKP